MMFGRSIDRMDLPLKNRVESSGIIQGESSNWMQFTAAFDSLRNLGDQSPLTIALDEDLHQSHSSDFPRPEHWSKWLESLEISEATQMEITICEVLS